MEVVRQGLIEKVTIRKVLKEIMNIWGESIPSRGNSLCKNLKIGVYLACSRNS